MPSSVMQRAPGQRSRADVDPDREREVHRLEAQIR
jgi:hypothetical protein